VYLIIEIKSGSPDVSPGRKFVVS